MPQKSRVYPRNSDIPVLVRELCTRIAKLDAMPSQHLLVAEDPGASARLLGWLQAERRLVLTAGERAEIIGLVVDTAARRRGVGTLLINAVQQWALAANLGQIVVRSNVVRDASHEFLSGPWLQPREDAAYLCQVLGWLAAGARVRTCRGNPSCRAPLPSDAGCCRSS